MKKYKEFKDLTFTDDFMFCNVLQNKTICKSILDLLLEKKIGQILEIRKQEIIENGRTKGVRLDVLATGRGGSLYNIEMQTTDEKNIPKRMRFYQAALDGSSLSTGMDYNDLPDTFVIFICTFDLFRKNLPVYTFEYFCRENKDIELEDGITKIVVNSRAFSKAENADLKDFLAYVNGKKNENKLVQMIEDEIGRLKQNEKLRGLYMQFYNIALMDERREGIAIGEKRGEARGITLGRQEGAYQKALETARNSKSIGLSTQQIAKITGLSVKEIEELD